MNPFQAQFDVINYFPCEKGFFTPPRVFHYPYLLYVHSGKGDYKIGQKRYSCVQGDLFFAGKGKKIRFLLTEMTRSYYRAWNLR